MTWSTFPHLVLTTCSGLQIGAFSIIRPGVKSNVIGEEYGVGGKGTMSEENRQAKQGFNAGEEKDFRFKTSREHRR